MKENRDEFYFKKYKEVKKRLTPKFLGMSIEEQSKSMKLTFCKASSILLFRMERAIDFFKLDMSEYVSKESFNSEFGLTIFNIDLGKLEGHYYKGWKPDRSHFLSSPERYLSDESIRVIANTDGYGAIVTSEDVYFDNCKDNKQEEIHYPEKFLAGLTNQMREEFEEEDREFKSSELSCARNLSSFFKENDSPELIIRCFNCSGLDYEELEKHKIEEGDPRFFKNYKIAKTYSSCLLDIIINEKLQKAGHSRKIIFIAKEENSYCIKEYRPGSWDVCEYLMHEKEVRDAIRYVHFVAPFTREESLVKKIKSLLSNVNLNDFSGEGLLEDSGLSANGLCSFDLSVWKNGKREHFYTEYYYSPEPEDSLLALVAANLFRADLILKEEKYIAAMHDIKKIHDKDVADVYKYITEIKAAKATMSLGYHESTPRSIFIRWLTITNTEEMLDDAEDIAQYIVSEVERKTEKTSQVLLNFIAALTVISAINDLLSMGYQNEHTPLGIIIALFSVVLVALVGVTFFSNLNGRKSKYFIISFILILLFVIAKYGGLFSGIGRFLGESIVYLRNTFLLQH